MYKSVSSSFGPPPPHPVTHGALSLYPLSPNIPIKVLKTTKALTFTFLLLFALTPIGAQTKATLAILPFTGGQGTDGETIAELFSFQRNLTAVFSPVPRTSINSAIRNERGFQMESGMTDPDTIAALGRQLGATYVVAGTITKLGNQNLLIIAILHTESLRQIAGDIQTYNTITDIEGKLPAMSQNIAAAVKIDTSRLPLLALPPVQLLDGADKREADALAQILAVHLIQSGKYAVYPRTKSLEQVQEEYGYEFNGDTADEYLPAIGRAGNPRLVLSVAARRWGNGNKFNAAVINLETGVQAAGDSVDYQSLNDGLAIMEELALRLTGQDMAVAKRVAENEAARKKAAATTAAAQKKAEAQRNIREHYPFSYWSMSLNVGSTFTTPGLTLSPAITIPIVKVAYVDLGCDFGFF
ncbi:MAG: penicillin-binding protein activator LpoB, partial [Treponema sp.]|nr:penicillin-binding protein activator LpoB [Treponema sp.]